MCEWLTEKVDAFSGKLKLEAKEAEEQEVSGRGGEGAWGAGAGRVAGRSDDLRYS